MHVGDLARGPLEPGGPALRTSLWGPIHAAQAPTSPEVGADPGPV